MKNETARGALFAVLVALGGCAAAPAPGGRTPGADEAKAVTGSPGSAEGKVEVSGAGYVLRGDDGRELYTLLDAPSAYPRAALGHHVGERVALTGVSFEDQGKKFFRPASLVVTRGGEFDRVIAAIVAGRCAAAPIETTSSFRLDPIHTLEEARFSVHVQAAAANYQVWVSRKPGSPSGYAVENILRADGKVLAPVCPAS